MDLIVKNPHIAAWGGQEFRCAIGRGGLIAAEAKREGDGATPIGTWKMREIIYRADRIQLPTTSLPARAMQPDDGWCEIPEDARYNQLVKHPYATPVDKMWRDDHLYDVVVVLGYNDDPVVAGKGSAIFLHLARPDFSPSAGCVTLSLDDLLRVVRGADKVSAVAVLAPT
ncbi:MAG: L,D-transpeptidase family protein [Alphaproteobacteria bacterium]